MLFVIGPAAKIRGIGYYQANGTQDEYEQIAKNTQDQKQDQERSYIEASRKFVGVGMRVFHY